MRNTVKKLKEACMFQKLEGEKYSNYPYLFVVVNCKKMLFQRVGLPHLCRENYDSED